MQNKEKGNTIGKSVKPKKVLTFPRKPQSHSTASPVKSRWKPEYDEIVTRLTIRGLSAKAILIRMLDDGYPVAIEDVNEARKRLKLNYEPPVHEKVAPYQDKLNPLKAALEALGDRFTHGQNALYLDGKPKNLETIMRTTNAIRKAKGEPEILHNSAWKAD